MKKNLLFGTLLLCSVIVVASFAQKDNVGIGTVKPDQSAVLDINSTNKGLLIPRMSLHNRNAITNPAQGLMVYQSDFLSGFYYFDGKEWKSVATASEKNSMTESTDNDWSKTGNANIDPALNFIGTTDFKPLLFRVNNIPSGGIIPATNSVYIGINAGNNPSNVGPENFGFGVNSLRNTTTGQRNIGMGNTTLYGNTTGSNNVAVGYGSYGLNTTGNNNSGIGSYSGEYNTTGSDNLAIGYKALSANDVGSDNIAIGLYAGGKTKSNRNVFIGTESGYNNLGSDNVMIGYKSGTNETGSNKLYIANSNTSTPLIGGDYANNVLKFHTGTAAPTASTGYLAVGDFSAAGSTATPGTGAINTFPAFTAASKYRLVVQDGILTEKLKVALRNGTEWADYVFEPEYKANMMSLEQVEAFTLKNKHLPNVPSAEQMAKDGLDVTQTSAKLMEKIEELTLYMIEMNKELKNLKKENEALKKSIEK